MAENDGKAGAGKHVPLLLLNRVTYKKVTAQVKAETHALLLKYVAFYQKAQGVKPEESELVDAALARAFQDDGAFQDFLKNGGGGSASVSRPSASAVEGGKGGGQT